MADGLQGYNLPQQMPVQLPVRSAPSLYAPQTAPVQGGDPNAIAPQYNSPAVPQPIDYSARLAAMRQSQPTAMGAGPGVEQGSPPPPFSAILQMQEQRLGRKLSPDEFDQIAGDYRTNFAVPTLNTEYKGKKGIVDSQIAAFDNGVAHLRSQRYAGEEEDKKSSSSVMDFLKSAGQQFGSVLGPGTLAYGSRILGGLTSLEGAAPNKVSDAFFGQASPESGLPPAIATAKDGKEAGTEFAKLIMGSSYGNPAFAGLQSKLEAQGQNKYDSHGFHAGETEAKWSNAARERSPLGATTGDVAALLSVFLGNEAGISRLARLPELAADASKTAKLARFLPTATLTANRTATDTAAHNVERGDELSKVLPQLAADQGLSTLFNLMPASLTGKLLKRAATGGILGTAQTGVQSAVDQGINPNNPAMSGKDYLTNAGFQAALAAILGARGAKAPEAPKGGETPPVGGETPPAGAAAATGPGTDTASPTAIPIDTLRQAMNSGPAEGVAPDVFTKLQADTLTKANARYKRLKPELDAIKTPEQVADGAMKLTQVLVGDKWAKLNPEQRSQTIETLALWLAKKAKVDTDAVGEHFTNIRNPSEATATQTAPVTETQLPGDITGQQVSGTVEQETPTRTAEAPTSTYVPKPEHDAAWTQITDQNIPTEKLPKTAQMLREAVTSGKIKDRQDFDNLLDQAAKVKAAKVKAAKNKLKAKPAKKAEPTVEDTVSETLADNTTKETQKNKLKAKAKTKEQTPEQYNQSYLEALRNDQGPSTGPIEDAIRADPMFNAARAEMRAGKITNAADVGRFLANKKGTSSVSTELAGHENKNVGFVLKGRSNKAEDVQARKAIRENILDPLTTLGEDPNAVKKMTVGEATAHLQKLVNTFSTDVGKPPKKTKAETPKTLKKTNIKPVENPDEPPPPKPKGKLKKTNVAPVEKPASTRSLNKSKAAETKAKVIEELKTLGVEKSQYEGKSLKELYVIRDIERGSKALRETTKSPKSEAPAVEAGASPLESQLRGRFGDTLPLKRLDAIHNAIEEARAGDTHALDAELAGLRAVDNIGNKDVKWLKGLAKERPLEDIQNNASGESSASLEAQRRLADERAAGQTRAIIRRDGTVEPMHTVDAVDTHARAGEVVVQRGIGKDDWTILSHGDDISRSIAEGKINRAKKDLEATHEEARNPTFEEAEVLNDTARERTKGTELEPDKIVPVQTKRRVAKIINEVRQGADIHETGRKLQKLHEDMEQATNERRMREAMRPERRGIEYVRARLQKMVADSKPGDTHYEAGKMALWLLDKNPNLANYLAIRIRQIKSGATGQFFPHNRLINLNSSDINTGTGVHEILHSAEQLMPPEMQNKIRGEYIGRLQNKYKQVVKSGNEVAQRYLQLAIESYVHPSAEGQREMSLLMRTQQKHLPYDEYYKYSNPSEYFAVEGTNILSRRYEAGSVGAKLQTWMKEFVEHIKALFGMDNNSQVIKAINQTLKSEGVDYNPKMLASERKVLNDEKIDPEQVGETPTDEQLGYEGKEETSDPFFEKEPPVVRAKESDKNMTVVSKAQHFIEHYMAADYGLEKMMQNVRKMGIKVTEKNNVENAAYAKNGLQSEHNNKDMFEAYQPAENWLYVNMSRFAKNMPELLDKVNMFFHNTNWLERGYTSWYLESPVGIEGAFKRADILEQVEARTLSGKDARKQLIDIANKSAVYKPDEWMAKQGMPVELLRTKLAELSKNSGMNEKTMADLNTLMDAARQRTNERLIAAGKYAEDDPYLDLYGWKWYVPLKGSAYGSDNTNFDMIPTKNLALGRLNKQIEAMQGRKSFAERPFSRLFADMSRAGSAQADAHVKNATYELVTDIIDHNPKSGYEIHTFEGGFKEGYTNTKTGEKVDRLKAPSNGIIVNDGDVHYVITMPKDSQLLRGLIKMNEVERPNAVESVVSHPTNGLARLYTTLHPGWQTFSGFIRDLTYIPITDAVQNHSNPLMALPTWGRYAANVAQAYKALPTLVPHLLANNPRALRALGLKTPRQMGEADPGSWAGWTRRYEAAGGANYFTQGFDVAGMERLMQGRLKDVDGILDAGKWTWKQALEYTGNYANFLEGIGRVAMFKTKVEQGVSETQAAVEVRKLLDYSKSGLKGRRINSWLAFFRVGMTGADAMRRAFTTPTGEINYKKMAAWQGFMGSLGAMGYMAFVAMVGENEAKKVNPNLLTQKILFPFGDKIAGVNLGLGLPQVLMAPGILAAARENGHITNTQALQLYADTLARNGPISPAGNKDSTPTNFLASYILGFTPTVARPVVDVARNTNVFNSSIHRDADNNAFPSDSGRPNTPKVFKDAARWLADVTDHKIDYYPEDIRYFVQSYGGQWATDLVKEATQDPEVQAGAPTGPNRLAGKFIVDTSHYMQNEMYDTLNQLQDSQRRYKSIVSRATDDGATSEQAKAQADQIISRDPQFRKEIAAYKALDSARRKYQQEIKALRSNKLLSDTRRQLIRKRLDSQMREEIEKAQASIPTE